MAEESGSTGAKTKKSTEKSFTKEQLLKSKAYHDKRDLLNALLADGEKYTKTQANKLVSDYLKKEVK